MRITNEGFIELSVTSQMIANAKERSKELQNLHGSITGGLGSLGGCIGEEACKIVIPELEEVYDFDKDFLYHGYRIDSKTLRCNSRPYENYDVNIFSKHRKQKCDIYVFNRILNTNKTIWIVGFMMKKDFRNQCITRYKGHRREDGFIYSDDTDLVYNYNLVTPFTKKTFDKFLGIKNDTESSDVFPENNNLSLFFDR